MHTLDAHTILHPRHPSHTLLHPRHPSHTLPRKQQTCPYNRERERERERKRERERGRKGGGEGEREGDWREGGRESERESEREMERGRHGNVVGRERGRIHTRICRGTAIYPPTWWSTHPHHRLTNRRKQDLVPEVDVGSRAHDIAQERSCALPNVHCRITQHIHAHYCHLFVVCVYVRVSRVCFVV